MWCTQRSVKRLHVCNNSLESLVENEAQTKKNNKKTKKNRIIKVIKVIKQLTTAKYETHIQNQRRASQPNPSEN